MKFNRALDIINAKAWKIWRASIRKDTGARARRRGTRPPSTVSLSHLVTLN